MWRNGYHPADLPEYIKDFVVKYRSGCLVEHGERIFSIVKIDFYI